VGATWDRTYSVANTLGGVTKWSTWDGTGAAVPTTAFVKVLQVGKHDVYWRTGPAGTHPLRGTFFSRRGGQACTDALQSEGCVPNVAPLWLERTSGDTAL